MEENKKTCEECGAECENPDNPKCADCCAPDKPSEAPTEEAPTEPETPAE